MGSWAGEKVTSVESRSATLEVIEAIAQREAEKLQHFWVGVEHLFIALTRLEGGVTHQVLDQLGHAPSYLRYAVRSEAGAGDPRRGNIEFQRSPRAEKVITRAQFLMQQGIQPAERAVLWAILDDPDSIPMRVLRTSRINRRAIREMLQEWTGEVSIEILPEIDESKLDRAQLLTQDQREVLQSMFRKYDSVTIEKRFGSSTYSGATVLLVKPRITSGPPNAAVSPNVKGEVPKIQLSAVQQVAAVVVKLHDKSIIRWEKKRYDEAIRDKLPSHASPTAEPTEIETSKLGGLRYYFAGSNLETPPKDLAEFIRTHTAEQTARLIREGVYGSFKAMMWGQGRLNDFIAWQEYDYLLPPALYLDYRPPEAMLPTSRTLVPLDEWIWDESIHTGEIVAIRDFYYARNRPERRTVQFFAGAGAAAANMVGRVDVFNMDLGSHKFYRGEPAPKIVGKVSQTRDDALQDSIVALEPDFDLSLGRLPRRGSFGGLPNPLRAYRWLLMQRLRGRFAVMHGDMHPGNVLVTRADSVVMIDFEWAREGHVLCDWAMLEVSILIDHIAPLIGDGWAAAWEALALLHEVNLGQLQADAPDDNPILQALHVISTIRGIVRELMSDPEHCAHEYYIPLALVALRVINWQQRGLKERRFAFLAAALYTEMAERYTARCREKQESLTDEKTDSNLYKG